MEHQKTAYLFEGLGFFNLSFWSLFCWFLSEFSSGESQGNRKTLCSHRTGEAGFLALLPYLLGAFGHSREGRWKVFLPGCTVLGFKSIKDIFLKVSGFVMGFFKVSNYHSLQWELGTYRFLQAFLNLQPLTYPEKACLCFGSPSAQWK